MKEFLFAPQSWAYLGNLKLKWILWNPLYNSIMLIRYILLFSDHMLLNNGLSHESADWGLTLPDHPPPLSHLKFRVSRKIAQRPTITLHCKWNCMIYIIMVMKFVPKDRIIIRFQICVGRLVSIVDKAGTLVFSTGFPAVWISWN